MCFFIFNFSGYRSKWIAEFWSKELFWQQIGSIVCTIKKSFFDFFISFLKCVRKTIFCNADIFFKHIDHFQFTPFKRPKVKRLTVAILKQNNLSILWTGERIGLTRKYWSANVWTSKYRIIFLRIVKNLNRLMKYRAVVKIYILFCHIIHRYSTI